MPMSDPLMRYSDEVQAARDSAFYFATVESTPDPAGTPRWDSVDVCFAGKFSRVLTLAELKAVPALAGLALVGVAKRRKLRA